MNTLTMGPLPVRVKREGENLVFRCGVVSCPEVLARAEWHGDEWDCHASEGYSQNNQSIFVKTRRAVNREFTIYHNEKDSRKDLREQIEFFEKITRFTPEQAKQLLKQKKEENLTDSKLLEWYVFLLCREEGRIYAKESLERYRVEMETGRASMRRRLYLSTEGAPLTFKCARCGRLSKISR